ncbi:alpha-tocopherol transfer protein-like [Caerostris darwini]|uniref:Alpha-tocopherol transfer protein-like n=1 Tax=Caerostris darwini TaxID=1538125 RepID=A0AAV4RJ52_9ARAC|nr:alpha-tocopherol transfer protein-like [Caerostris darwini]
MSLENIKATMHEKETYPFLMNFVPDSVLRKCEIELNETQENKLKGLEELKKMLTMEKLTNGIVYKDDYLTRYLRHSKYNVTRAFERLRKGHIYRKKYSNLFKSLPDIWFSSKTSTKLMRVLPKRCQDGCTIIVFRYVLLLPDEMALTEIKRMFVITFDQLLRDPMTQINGLKVIQDFRDAPLKLLRNCTPHNMYWFKHSGLDCFPGRFKEIHVLNESIVFKAAWVLLNRFLSEKIRKRIFFHSDPEELLDYFPRSVLPPEYGGCLEDTSTDDWIRKANKYFEQFKTEGQCNFY